MYEQASSSRPPALPGQSEFDILKASHKFLREDEDADESGAKASWEERLARKYYSSLYREFAVCDLKHYKSGNFALRWRTESEVISGAGEETCGNTRCPLHDPSTNAPSSSPSKLSGLKMVELPFAYEEHGERKSALVKIVLCDACLKKIMWKREKEKKERERRLIEDGKESQERGSGDDRDTSIRRIEKGRTEESVDKVEYERRERSKQKNRDEVHANRYKRKTSRSRSQSPSRRRKREHKDKDSSRKHDRSPV